MLRHTRGRAVGSRWSWPPPRSPAPARRASPDWRARGSSPTAHARPAAGVSGRRGPSAAPEGRSSHSLRFTKLATVSTAYEQYSQYLSHRCSGPCQTNSLQGQLASRKTHLQSTPAASRCPLYNTDFDCHGGQTSNVTNHHKELWAKSGNNVRTVDQRGEPHANMVPQLCCDKLTAGWSALLAK